MKSIAAKLDDDAMGELLDATTIYDANTDGTTADKSISYNSVCNTIDLFEEEENSEKVMFIHPLQVTTLRKDANFIDKTKYGNEVMVSGEIGIIGNARIVPSKRVACIGGCFYCPVVKLTNDIESEDDLPAITYFIKRNTNVETERKSRNRLTEITGDQMYVVALTNDSKVVIGKFNGAPLSVINMYEKTYTYPGTAFVFDTTGVTPSLTKISATAYTLNLAGVAPLAPTGAVAGLGYDSNTTNTAVFLPVAIPDAPSPCWIRCNQS